MKLNTGGAIQMILEKNIDMVSERAILLMALGSLQALEHQAITIDESQRILFSPYISTHLENNKVSKRVIDIITECCELEDIFELIPAKYMQTLQTLQNRIIEILKRYDEEPRKRWVIIDEK
nr:DUF3969 family protein [uncultured Campylobacter sp.]